MGADVCFVLPDCLPKKGTQFAQHPASELSLPYFCKLLSRSKSFQHTYTSAEAQLFETFSYPITKNLPIAALMALADGLAVSDEIWLRADFVEMRQDQISIYLMGYQHLNLSATEIESLYRSIKDFLPAVDDSFLTEEGRCYLRLKQTAKLNTTPIANIVGKDILAFMPEHESANEWRRSLTEIQMLLHNHEVNQQRVVSGKIPANSVWFWGEGRLPRVKKSSWDKLYSDDILAQGLAKYSKIDYDNLPNSILDLQESFTSNGQILIYDEKLRNAVIHADIESWQQHMYFLEENYFVPLLKMLQTKQINSLTLMLNDFHFVLSAQHSKRWWKKAVSFEDFT